MNAKVFVPHRDCTVASGDCFTEGKCLRKCKARAKLILEERVKELERRLQDVDKLVYRNRLRDNY